MRHERGEVDYGGSSVDPVLSSTRRISYAKSCFFVKGEDSSRNCRIELEPHVVVRFYEIFDGHGGPRAGCFCAEHLPSLIAVHYATAPGVSCAERIRAACNSAFVETDELFRIASPTRSDGATATCVIIDGDKVTTANVGDSTAILFIAKGESRNHRRAPHAR